MREDPCPNGLEHEVARCVRSGDWPEALLQHVQQCAACREARDVAAWVSARRADQPPATSDVDARRLWRIAANTRKGEQGRALRVLASARRFALALASVSALLAAGALRAPLAAVLAPLAGELQLAVAALADVAAQRAGLLTAVLLVATLRLFQRTLAR